MRALHFLLDTLITLYTLVLLIRLIMQLSRADFRNPIARAIVQLTNPVVLPLRRLLPPIGKLDTASAAAVLLFTLAKVWILSLLFAVAPDAVLLVRLALYEVIGLVLRTYLFAILLNTILSFIAPGNYSPAQSLLSSICDPVLNPIRRIIPPIGGLDLSPLWAMIAIQALLLLLL